MMDGWHKIAVKAGKVIRQQQRIIASLESSLENALVEKDAIELAYQRIGRDLIEQFLIALDHPENHDEIRERLITSLGFYRDEIAVHEEHIG